MFSSKTRKKYLVHVRTINHARLISFLETSKYFFLCGKSYCRGLPQPHINTDFLLMPEKPQHLGKAEARIAVNLSGLNEIAVRVERYGDETRLEERSEFEENLQWG